jgi:hypothetical protein
MIFRSKRSQSLVMCGLRLRDAWRAIAAEGPMRISDTDVSDLGFPHNTYTRATEVGTRSVGVIYAEARRAENELQREDLLITFRPAGSIRKAVVHVEFVNGNIYRIRHRDWRSFGKAFRCFDEAVSIPLMGIYASTKAAVTPCI